MILKIYCKDEQSAKKTISTLKRFGINADDFYGNASDAYYILDTSIEKVTHCLNKHSIIKSDEEMLKSAKEASSLFFELSEEIQDKIDSYSENGFISFLRSPTSAFTWEKTPEGHQYWQDIIMSKTASSSDIPPKFKVGDKVIIVADPKKNYPCGFNHDMKQFIGKVAEITGMRRVGKGLSILSDGEMYKKEVFDRHVYKLDIDGNMWNWTSPMLKLAESTSTVDKNYTLKVRIKNIKLNFKN